MEEKRPFSLLHFALYSKHWYKRFDHKGRSKNKTIWDDLRKTMTADDYQGDLMTKSDIFTVVLHQCQRINQRCFTDLVEVINGISVGYSWKSGYYTKECTWVRDCENLPDYDYYTAVIYYCLSSISCLSCEEMGIEKLPKPDYKNVLPRKKGIKDKRINEFFPE